MVGRTDRGRPTARPPVRRTRAVDDPRGETLEGVHEMHGPRRPEVVEGVLGERQLGIGHGLECCGPQGATKARAASTGTRTSLRPWTTRNGGATRLHPRDRRRRRERLGRLPARTPAVPGSARDWRCRSSRRRRSRRRRRAGCSRQRRCPRPRIRAASSASLAVRATRAARCPPAEPPGHKDEVRVAAVLGDVSLHPPSASLQSSTWRGHLAFGLRRIVGRHADEAPLGEVLEHRDALLTLVAHHPGAAVEVQEHRSRRRLADDQPCGTGRVDGPRSASSRIGDVAEPSRRRGPDRDGDQHPARVLGLQLHRGTPGPPRTRAASKRPARPQPGDELHHEAAAHATQQSARPTQPGQLPAKPPSSPQPSVAPTRSPPECSGASPTIQLGTKLRAEPTASAERDERAEGEHKATTPTARHAQLTPGCYQTSTVGTFGPRVTAAIAGSNPARGGN